MTSSAQYLEMFQYFVVCFKAPLETASPLELAGLMISVFAGLVSCNAT